MKGYRIELIIFLLALASIAVYIYKHIDWDKPKIHVISAVQVNNKMVPVSEVKVVQIPQATYDSMKDNPQWAHHLSGNKKRVLLMTWNGCPYARAYHAALDRAFGKSGIFNRYYIKDIEVTGQSVSGNCRGELAEHCPLVWIMNNCMGGICIINPLTKEAIVDRSQNAKQILPILMAYATWTTNPLTGGTK